MNKIPLSVSSTLTNIAANGFLTVNAYANNTGKTGTAAPVLIAVESDGTVGVEAFAEALPNKGGQGTAAQARLVINAMAEVLTDLVTEFGAVTVNTPLGRVDTFVAGSLEYATDPVDPTVNVPFLGIVPGADVMKAFAKIETYVPTAACPASLKRIRDVATGDNTIHGVQPFYAQGYGMTYGGTGETVKLLNALTRAEVCTLSVDSATKSQAQLKCTVPSTANVPVGAYILQVMTLAGGTETLWPLEIKVNVSQAVVPAPTITKIETDDLGGLNKGAGFNIKGTNLGYDASRGDEVKATWTEGSTPKSQTFVPSTITATKLDFPTTSAWDDANAGTIVTFTVKIDGTTLTKTSEVLGA